jgi:cyclophilin family peptidyl-prolyl cis-trans isomerase
MPIPLFFDIGPCFSNLNPVCYHFDKRPPKSGILLLAKCDVLHQGESAVKLFSFLGVMLVSLGIGAIFSASTDAAEKNPVVTIETSMGDIQVELFADKAPITVKNFLSYVDDKFYDGTLFHRVMSNFMIQGGGLEPGLKDKKTKAPIKNESDNGVSNERGTIAMARTGRPDSATSQFFINVKDNSRLDKAKYADGVGYCVFGKVIKGMDVVDKIKEVKVEDKGEHEKVPVKDVIIKSIRVAK